MLVIEDQNAEELVIEVSAVEVIGKGRGLWKRIARGVVH